MLHEDIRLPDQIESSEVAFVLEAIYKKVVCLNTQRNFNVIMVQSLKIK